MDWTYSGDPTTSPKDEVRFLCGDTNAADPQLLDAEVNYNILIVYGNNPPALGNFLPAAYCADAIAAKYMRQADESVGDLRIAYSNRMKNFQAMAKRLRARAALASVPVYVGGQSIAEKQAAYSNSDLITTAVRIDGMDNADSLNPPLDGSSQTTVP